MKNILIINQPAISKSLVLILAIIAAGCGIVSLPGSKPAVMPFAPPPAGTIPAQIGNFKMIGEPHQEDYSTDQKKTYSADYQSPQNSQVHYQLTISTAPTPPGKPSDVPLGWELLSSSGATKVYFAAGLEELFIEITGEGTRAKFDCSGIADVNDLLKNIPYQALKIAPPATLITVALPPPPFDKKNTSTNSAGSNNLADAANKSQRDLAMSVIKTTLQAKFKVETNSQVNKIDSSTLMIHTTKDLDNSTQSAVEDGIKKGLGDSLKKMGFRQFVLYPDVVKLD